MLLNYTDFNFNKPSPNREKIYIKQKCKEHSIHKYTINNDMSIDVDDDVNLFRSGIYAIPLNFNIVNGFFNCSTNDIFSLEGCPKIINGYFNCGINRLKSLEHCTKEINGNFYCHRTTIKSLIGGPTRVFGDFSCNDNNLTTLEYLPSLINGVINCQGNNIKTFKGVPVTFNDSFNCMRTPLYEIYKYFDGKSESIFWINEYDVIQGDNIIMDRLEEVFIEMGENMPNIESVKGYNLVY